MAWEAKRNEWKPAGVAETDTAAVQQQRDEWLKANPRPEGHAEPGGGSHRPCEEDRRGGSCRHRERLRRHRHDADRPARTSSTFPALFAELIRRGWSDDDLKKLARYNILRVLRENEQVAARLQKTKRPSVQTIQQLDGASSAQSTP